MPINLNVNITIYKISDQALNIGATKIPCRQQ
jgi:hypothetical protein